jgi:hypothetical protein
MLAIFSILEGEDKLGGQLVKMGANIQQQRVNQFNTRVTRANTRGDLEGSQPQLKIPNQPGVMPSAKPKPHDQKDQKKQKSLLGWLSKPAGVKVAQSSSDHPPIADKASITVASSSPSGRESILETPSTKKRALLGDSSPAVGSATFSRSSDGGRSINDTPPTSDPIDVDISSDEDVPRRESKSVCDSCICAFVHSWQA